MSEWISLNKKVPNNGDICLCFCEHRYFIAMFSGNDFLLEFVEFIDGKRISRYASHWMSLPNPPEEK